MLRTAVQRARMAARQRSMSLARASPPPIWSEPSLSAIATRLERNSHRVRVPNKRQGMLELGIAAMMRQQRQLGSVTVSISECFGHAAFLLGGAAYVFDDILHLRALSVVSGAAAIVFSYFHPVGQPLWLPIRWNAAFMLINLMHIYRCLNERLTSLTPQAQCLYDEVFAVSRWPPEPADRSETACDLSRAGADGALDAHRGLLEGTTNVYPSRRKTRNSTTHLARVAA